MQIISTDKVVDEKKFEKWVKNAKSTINNNEGDDDEVDIFFEDGDSKDNDKKKLKDRLAVCWYHETLKIRYTFT